MERLITIILTWLLVVSCAMQKESYSHREELKRERAYDANYDTIRYFDSTFVRTFQTDSLREILRERVILGERTVKEVHYDTLMQWERDTIYIKEMPEEKKEKTAPLWWSALALGIFVGLILFFKYVV